MTITNLWPTDEEIKLQDARWKSDVDFKLDALLEYNDKNARLIELLTERESRRAKMQQAIIDKSIAGLVYAGIAALATLVWAGARDEVRTLLEALNMKKP